MRMANPSLVNTMLGQNGIKNATVSDSKNQIVDNTSDKPSKPFQQKINGVISPIGIAVEESSNRGSTILLVLLFFAIYGIWTFVRRLFSSSK